MRRRRRRRRVRLHRRVLRPDDRRRSRRLPPGRRHPLRRVHRLAGAAHSPRPTSSRSPDTAPPTSTPTSRCRVPNLRHVEYFHDHHLIETRYFDGTLSPSGGSLCPRSDSPGHGLTFRQSDAGHLRVA